MLRLLSLALVASVSLAQTPQTPIDLEPTRQRVQQLLSSPLPRDQAWGAYLVGDLNLDELAPDLINFIEQEAPRGFDGEREFALRAAVDSMIRLHISPPAGLLEPFFETISYETIILFSQAPQHHSGSLLKLAQAATRPSERFALLNLIVHRRPLGAAAWLLEDLEIKAALSIADPGFGPGVGAGSRGGVSGRCTRRLGVPKGYPPFAIYGLSPDPWTRDVVLTGPAGRAIYYYRAVVAAGPASPLHCETDSPLTSAERIEYIEKLGAHNLKSSYIARVVPAAGENVQGAAAKLRAEVEADYYEAVQRLEDEGALTFSEAAGLRPIIDLTIVDRRREN